MSFGRSSACAGNAASMAATSSLLHSPYFRTAFRVLPARSKRTASASASMAATTCRRHRSSAAGPAPGAARDASNPPALACSSSHGGRGAAAPRSRCSSCRSSAKTAPASLDPRLIGRCSAAGPSIGTCDGGASGKQLCCGCRAKGCAQRRCWRHKRPKSLSRLRTSSAPRRSPAAASSDSSPESPSAATSTSPQAPPRPSSETGERAGAAPAPRPGAATPATSVGGRQALPAPSRAALRAAQPRPRSPSTCSTESHARRHVSQRWSPAFMSESSTASSTARARARRRDPSPKMDASAARPSTPSASRAAMASRSSSS
mmetsp:Transcript_80636/g.261333  ORF Transcript_80636/g.261333 Transcript_80636/m.261333 type:complete len:318 (-) Transcript_80636:279-1232(-)